MGQDPGEVGTQQLDDTQKSPEQLRAEIEETRGDLGDTVEALAAKTDVKARARERVEELKQKGQDKKEQLLSKAGRSSTSDSDGTVPAGNGASPPAGPSAVEKLKGAMRENPVPMAALAAFVGGMAFGRLLSRP